MPEGDTIFRAARTLQQALGGEIVTRFESALAHLARQDDDAPVAGRTVEAVSAAGKHVLMRFSGDLVLRTHMRMNGSWHLYRPGEAWQRPRGAMRVLVATARFVAVGFDIPVAEFLDGDALLRQDDLRLMGPDLLAPAFDAAEAARRIRARPEEEIGEVLLDQRVVAGAGNVFKSEILFLARLNPVRKVASLTDAEISQVLATGRKLLAANVVAGGNPSRRTTGRLAKDEGLWVYGRGGEPCRRCASPIAFARQGIHARVTYWCPRCQPG
jgi:endonuclease VIII